jgi:hypothetical protein
MPEPERAIAEADARRILAETFTSGADAMRSRVVAFLMARGLFDVAPLVMTMALPSYEGRITEKGRLGRDAVTPSGGAGG